MANYHQDDIQAYFKDVFEYEGDVKESAEKMTNLFIDLGLDMYFEGNTTKEAINRISIESSLNSDEIAQVILESIH